jgi:pullulanase/glycogen debranching enzyme
LPAFDIASVNEDKSTWQTVDEAKLASYPPDSDQQSIAVSAITGSDGFNWGYDPLHYTTPEGSYATDPKGTPRIIELNEHLQSERLRRWMWSITIRMPAAKENLCWIALCLLLSPIEPDGAVETSTCCQNTATEHTMIAS